MSSRRDNAAALRCAEKASNQHLPVCSFNKPLAPVLAPDGRHFSTAASAMTAHVRAHVRVLLRANEFLNYDFEAPAKSRAAPQSRFARRLARDANASHHCFEYSPTLGSTRLEPDRSGLAHSRVTRLAVLAASHVDEFAFLAPLCTFDGGGERQLLTRVEYHFLPISTLTRVGGAQRYFGRT